MGYTKFTCDLIERYLNGVKSVVDLGSQNDYRTVSEKPPFVSEWYKEKGVEYSCIDLAGDNGALKFDLSNYFQWSKKTSNKGDFGEYEEMLFDLVADVGTSEHIVAADHYQVSSFHDGHINSIYPKENPTGEEIKKGYYNCWYNKFNLCKENGLIISENPLTKNWPEHGYSYLGADFYDELCKVADLEIIEQGLEPATGNTADGWNIWCVLKKTGDKFPSPDEFNKLPIHRE